MCILTYAFTPPGGPLFRLKGSILSLSFLDCNGALVPYSYESWKDEGKRESKLTFSHLLQKSIIILLPETPTKGLNTNQSPTLNQDSTFGDRQFMVITSEKQCRVVALPSQNCVYRLQITETDFVVKAEIISLKGKIRNLSFYNM